MEQNELYPIFLKVTQLEVLIVGGGNVGLEKLTFLLKSSPNAKVTVVAPNFHQKLIELAKNHYVILIEDSYKVSYLTGKHMVIATTDNIAVNVEVYKDCKDRHILVNVADNPPYCDFYMGGIVTKGNIKIAISTNGKSPTLAKRLRQFFEDVLPNDIDDLAKNLNEFRKKIKGDFSNKVAEMNKLTEKLL
ncbi:precorrin-2 dehydrogenase/sirohydrochlorin ferrochelatase family protein [Lutibacter maritimus]|uniref:precorrin-2 dehydrogenase n=1 Tax=Lutibacter maritimus TaxID=593133 RepID=A0A1I6QNF5_9FLAO|nr:bifunctional precorrin-2 dehydrogenase/sirohydrochlorin ferrochelatase [Lutibacter maritimus]SFS53981.1 precorrin-2 dehydrogenase / sirohydrochlorin ferrochelatase [Lutibacter maritimus]